MTQEEQQEIAGEVNGIRHYFNSRACNERASYCSLAIKKYGKDKALQMQKGVDIKVKRYLKKEHNIKGSVNWPSSSTNIEFHAARYEIYKKASHEI